MRKRTAARQLALQALYQWDLRGEDFRLDLEGFLAEWSKDPESIAYARELTLGCRDGMAEIDAMISEMSRNWTMERMTAVDRNVLRLGAFELLFRGDDVPPRVAIDEAVELAKSFSTRPAAGLVNGILDRIMNSSQRDGFDESSLGSE